MPPKRQRVLAGVGASLADRWGDRYIELQEPGKAKCGQHALNNVIGAPQFDEDFFDLALEHICGAEWQQCEADHRRDFGWYSHGVLAKALQLTVPPEWVLSLAPLEPGRYQAFLSSGADELGAIVNLDDVHWIAIVKHDGILWRVDSLPPHLTILDSRLFDELVQPRTAFVVYRDEGVRLL